MAIPAEALAGKNGIVRLPISESGTGIAGEFVVF